MLTRFVDETNGLGFELDRVPVLSSSWALASLAPVREVRHVSGALGAARELRLDIPEAAFSIPVPLDLLEDSERTGPSPVFSRTHVEALDAVRTVTETHLEAFLDGRPIGRVPLVLLPPSHWSHARQARRLAAAHALPGDDTVSGVIGGASRFSGRSLAEMALAGRPETGPALDALYRYLAEECAIDYDAPEIVRLDALDASYQRVLTPAEVLAGPDARGGRGNCLDLTLLLAGCLETLGLAPLLIFTGDIDKAPTHVFLGCWKERAERFRPLLTDVEDLRRRAEQGELIVLESTGVCHGKWALDVGAAGRAALETLNTDPVHAVDVHACRPPNGGVRPLVPANDPLVQRAYWLGDRFGDGLSARRRETIHILYGLCEAGGEITTHVLENTGSSPDRVRHVLEKNLRAEGHTEPPRPTKNWETCRGAARTNARNRGGSIVEECDLLWAVVENPSRNVKKVLQAAGCDVAALLQELERRWEGLGEMTFSRSFRSRSSTM